MNINANVELRGSEGDKKELSLERGPKRECRDRREENFLVRLVREIDNIMQPQREVESE